MKLDKRTEFSLKSIILIMLVFFLIFDLYLTINLPKKSLVSLRIIDRLDVYYAFFTTQSNYLVCIYLIFALLLKRIYKTKPAFGIQLAVTVYITVTMLIFWGGIVASSNEAQNYSVPNWISTVVLHLLIPILMIAQFIVSNGNVFLSYKEHTKFSFFAIAAYPMFYLIFSLIRGEYRYQAYGPGAFSEIFNYNGTNWEIIQGSWMNGEPAVPYSNQMFYSYWFLDFKQYKLESNGMVAFDHTIYSTFEYALIFIGVCLIITALVCGLQYFYLYLNNSKYWRWHTSGKLLTKEEHDLKLKKYKLFKSNEREAKKEILIKYKESLINLKKEKANMELSDYNLKLKQLGEDKKTSIKLLTNSDLKAEEIYKNDNLIYKEFIKNLSTNQKKEVKKNLAQAKINKKLSKKDKLIESIE